MISKTLLTTALEYLSAKYANRPDWAHAYAYDAVTESLLVDLDPAVVEAAFVRVSQAHHEYETVAGFKDTNWAEWYASQLVDMFEEMTA